MRYKDFFQFAFVLLSRLLTSQIEAKGWSDCLSTNQNVFKHKKIVLLVESQLLKYLVLFIFMIFVSTVSSTNFFQKRAARLRQRSLLHLAQYWLYDWQ